MLNTVKIGGSGRFLFGIFVSKKTKLQKKQSDNWRFEIRSFKQHCFVSWRFRIWAMNFGFLRFAEQPTFTMFSRALGLEEKERTIHKRGFGENYQKPMSFLGSGDVRCLFPLLLGGGDSFGSLGWGGGPRAPPHLVLLRFGLFFLLVSCLPFNQNHCSYNSNTTRGFCFYLICCIGLVLCTKPRHQLRLSCFWFIAFLVQLV